MLRNEMLFKTICEKGEKVFIAPDETYKYESIIDGCYVKGHYGSYSTMYAVGSNTWRGFHKIDKMGLGAKEVFTSYFIKNKDVVIKSLKGINKEQELHAFENVIVQDIKSSLMSCIKKEMLLSYNKIRKPVDLYMEHILSMSEDFIAEDRRRLGKIMFLPLDSQMFSSEHIFDLGELTRYGLSRKSSFKDVYCEEHYRALQQILKDKAKNIRELIGNNFERIYFDLMWNNRFQKSGGNLFKTNL